MSIINSFKLEKTAINQWITMESCPPAEALKERCTVDFVANAVKRFGNVKVLSAGVETGKPDWPDNGHVVLEETSPGGKPVIINVWAPLNWNGRFIGCLGGGLRTFHMYEVLGRENRIAMPRFVLKNGFATANTDGGVSGETFAWGLDEKTKAVDYELILNFGYRSTHSMTVIAKAVVEALYGENIKYAYAQGASGGGRQSLSEAQLYPEDYDGIWAVDPAINWAGLFIGLLWPFAVMNEEKHYITPSKLEYYRAAAIAESGGRYDFIETADMPDFDPYKYVGKEAADGTITEADARVMKLIFGGPKTRDGHFLWYGFRPGTRFWSTGILGAPGGVYIIETPDGFRPQMNMLANGYIGAWLERNMDWDWQNITYKKFEELWKQSLRDYACLECNSPDLYDMKERGTKLLLSHAVNDDTIPSDGTLDYYRRVQNRMGGEEKTQNYFRFFLSPGGGHTDLKQPGLSFTLADGMIALMKWVEEGVAPEVIPGVWYDFEQGAEILTGEVPRFRLDKPNPGRNIKTAPAYEKYLERLKNTETERSGGGLNADSTIAEIMADEQGMAVLKEYLGAILDNPMFAQAIGMKIGALKNLMPVDSMKEKIAQAIAKLEALNSEGGDTKEDRRYW
jgi:feruloyl esterase